MSIVTVVIDFTAASPVLLFFSQVLKPKIQKKKYLSEKYKKFCYLSEGVLVYVLSLSCLFKLFNATMFCENTRGKLPENGQSEKATKMGLFKAKTKGSVLQSSRTVALEFNHTKGL